MPLINNFDPEEPAVCITSKLHNGMLYIDAQGLINHFREMANVIEAHKDSMKFISLTITPNGFAMKGVQETVAEIDKQFRKGSEVQ